MPANLTLLRTAGAAGVLLTLSGCTALGIGTNSDAALDSCPTAPVAANVLWDVSGSSASDSIVADRLSVVRDVARRTALCDGTLRVSLFSSSSSATITIFDRALNIEGATDQARLRKVDDYITEVMNEIEAGYGASAAQPAGGSDITSVLRLADEYSAQFPDHKLDLYVLTDGFQNVGFEIASAKAPVEAASLADSISTPDLSGAWVTFAGLGRVNDNTASSAHAELLVAFYSALCARTQADSCSVVTDYAAKW